MAESHRWQSTSAGAHLAGRRSKDTVPEVSLRRALHRLGYRYRLHQRLARGCTPDLVLARHRLVIFVDGCFWHGCPVHGRTTFNGPNAPLWEAKMRRNRERDERADRAAVDLGWQVLRLWECQIRDELSATLDAVATYCRPRS